jgi:hypothetical protein
MKGASLVSLRVTVPEGTRNGRTVGTAGDKITKQSQEVVVVQQDTVFGSENKAKSHGVKANRLLGINELQWLFWQAKPPGYEQGRWLTGLRRV